MGMSQAGLRVVGLLSAGRLGLTPPVSCEALYAFCIGGKLCLHAGSPGLDVWQFLAFSADMRDCFFRCSCESASVLEPLHIARSGCGIGVHWHIAL